MTQSKAMIMRTLTTNYLDIGWQLIVFHEKKLLEPQKKIWFLSQLTMQQVESSEKKK